MHDAIVQKRLNSVCGFWVFVTLVQFGSRDDASNPGSGVNQWTKDGGSSEYRQDLGKPEDGPKSHALSWDRPKP